MIIAVDIGHNVPYDGGAVSSYGNENELNMEVGTRVISLFKNLGHTVHNITPNTATSLADSLSRRSGAANAIPSIEMIVCIHHNAGGGTGTEAFVWNPSDSSRTDTQCGIRMSKKISDALGLPNRGIKNGSHLHMVRETVAPIVLIEVCFIDSKTDMDKHNPDKVAKAIVEAVLNTTIVDTVKKTPILGNASCTKEQAMAWAKSCNATEKFIGLAHYFWDNCSNHGGVNPALAYAQSAKETAYGRFGGVLDESFKNTCGLKNSSGGGDYDPNAHKTFETWEKGVSAQLDHLALYAGASGYPRSNTEDPRHFPYLVGTAPNIEDLGGRWAPSMDYGTTIVTMVEKMKSKSADGTYAEPTDRQEQTIISPPKPIPPVIEVTFREPNIGGGSSSFVKPNKEEICISKTPIDNYNILSGEIVSVYLKDKYPNNYLPVKLDKILEYYMNESIALGICFDLAICQALYETNFFTFKDRKIQPKSFNYGGIDYLDRKTFNTTFFETWEAGAINHLNRLNFYKESSYYFEDLSKEWLNIPYDCNKYNCIEEAINRRDDYTGKILTLRDSIRTYYDEKMFSQRIATMISKKEK